MVVFGSSVGDEVTSGSGMDCVGCWEAIARVWS